MATFKFTPGRRSSVSQKNAIRSALRAFMKQQISERLQEKKIDQERANHLLRYTPSRLLTKKQEWALGQYSKDKKKLVGESVKLTCDSMGRTAPGSSRYEGNIIGFGRPRQGMPCLKIHWTDDKTANVWLYQIDFLKEDPHLSDKERAKKMTRKLLKKITSQTNQQHTRLKQDLSSARRGRREQRKRAKQEAKRIKELTGKIKRYKKKNFKEEQLKEELKLIKKLETVEDVYISEKGNIIVLTEDLCAVADGKIRKRIKLGRYVICIDYLSGEARIKIKNRDWIFGDTHGHPHLSGTGTCWGGSATSTLSSALNEGRLFQLVDFIITFYSLFPQDEGASPNVDYNEWLEGREKTEDNSLIERRINARSGR